MTKTIILICSIIGLIGLYIADIHKIKQYHKTLEKENMQGDGI